MNLIVPHATIINELKQFNTIVDRGSDNVFKKINLDPNVVIIYIYIYISYFY